MISLFICIYLFCYLFINGNMSFSYDHHCVIEKHLQTPFSSLAYHDKLKAIEERAPKPNLLAHGLHVLLKG
jgi:hypothetical protein